MPLDAVKLAGWLTTLIGYAQQTLGMFPGSLLPAPVKQAANSSLTTAQAYVDSPQWPLLVAWLNNPK